MSKMYYTYMDNHDRNRTPVAGFVGTAASVACCGLRCAKDRFCDLLKVICCCTGMSVMLALVIYLSIFPVTTSGNSNSSKFLPY